MMMCGHEEFGAGAPGAPRPSHVEISRDRVEERLREELKEQDPVVTAAMLAATAFRLKDERGLVAALRNLALAVDQLAEVRGD